MKNKYLIVLLLSVISITTHSQIYHTSGQSMLSGGVSATKYSFMSRYQLDYTMINRDRVFWRFGLSTDFGEIDLLKYEDYFVNIRYGRVIYDLKGKLFLNGLGGFHLGYQNFIIPEFLEGGNLGEFQRGYFNYGVNVGLEIEYFPLNRIGISTDASQMITFNSPLGDKRYHFNATFLSINLKYIIY